MKILILGGTGAMGKHLVNLLRDSGDDVVITTRANRESFRNISYIVGNARDDKFLDSILKGGWDVIIDFMVYTTAGFKKRIDLLLESTSQYVFLSSARVYADSNTPIKEASARLLDVTDDNEFLASDEYSLAKARQEDILKTSGKRNWTIIRPYITYSSHRLQLGILEKEDWLYRTLHGRTIVFSDEISSTATTMTYGLDVANGIKSIIGNNNALGEIYHITSNQAFLWSEILDIYLNVLEKHLGYRPKVILEGLDSFQKYHSAVYQIKYDRLYNRRFNNDKIGNLIDTDNFTLTEIGIASCLEEFLEHPSFKQINWRAEALKDRETNEFTPLSEIKGLKQKIKYLLYRLGIK